eukprot:752654-Hanusia_phi.AAC.2
MPAVGHVLEKRGKLVLSLRVEEVAPKLKVGVFSSPASTAIVCDPSLRIGPMITSVRSVGAASYFCKTRLDKLVLLGAQEGVA